MKKKYTKISDRIEMVGNVRGHGRNRVIDFYLTSPAGEKEYAFTRRYSNRSYDLVRGGISVKRLLSLRSKDCMVMNLVKYLSYMMPYFTEEIEWMAA